VSRMIYPDAKYAVAVPLTIDFKKVLKTYSGSFGFERLSVYFFIVYRDGLIKEYKPKEMVKFVDSL
jgi:hypothetical protein